MAYRYKQITKLSEAYPNEQIYVIHKKHEKYFATTVPDKRLDAALKNDDYKLMVWRYDEEPSWYEGIDEYGRLRDMRYKGMNMIFGIKDVLNTAKDFEVDQSDVLETFLCDLLDISPDRLYEMLAKQKNGDSEMKGVRELWAIFGEIPIDDNDRILESFYKFPKGTSRFDVWNWFEEEFNVSVAMDLMGLEGSEV